MPAPFAAAARAGGFTGAAGQSLRLADPPALLVGIGAPTAAGFEAAGALAASCLAHDSRATLDARGRAPWAVAALATGAGTRAHRTDHLRSAPKAGLDRLDLWVEDPGSCAPALRRAEAALAGASLARTLAAEPGNILTPRTFARRLRALEEDGITVRVHGRDALHRMGAGGLLAVGSGSAEPPRLVVLRWKGRGGKGAAAPSSSSERASPSTRGASPSSRPPAWRR
ncbi:hypothetical protein ACE7GA_13425 [Roseomonas sp. CCTCC AB2023176]|uniref:hypothetical protein n=1 Tax=Roseomonas sp. CCTCC AB2023176 TaxID=3342640 RepID=UPI0035DC9377